ncbi:heme ABC transporter ATP-binding protein [Brachybacterium halotolerans subsp. kimchii]|uniref:heme ABC transporter ATP-binding protein n=1 Tax=Brachybacterium halotolerans TaxID=2795215 RepID=UPI001E430A1D|nr:heme ABC transporter ATP-binding protein [Brachybacterium halotolerans]UEJ82039.1 heme ABC transporter ATP-binding protein [Brachybacterium halotolerans subsp. kimchii]
MSAQTGARVGAEAADGLAAGTEEAGAPAPGTTGAEPWIRVEQAGFAIGGAVLLQDVEFSASGGELVALVGPNGAGKSTLLSLLSGDQRPTSGRVLLDGRPTADWPAKALARRRSVMTQHHSQAFSFTVHEAAAMGRAPHPVGPDDDALIERCLREADVDALAGRDVTTLSGGELARTVFARVLAQDAQVVLLDEPTAALDLHHQEVLMARARELAQEGRCVLVVLHDLTLAARCSDRIAMFDGGRLVALGPPGDVLTPDRIREVYRHEVAVLEHPTSGRPLVVPL